MKTRTKLILAAVVIVAAVAGLLILKENWIAIIGAGGIASLFSIKKPSVNEAEAKKAGEDAKQAVMDTPPATVVSGLDADTRARIDEAKQPAVIETKPIVDGSLDDAQRLSDAHFERDRIPGPGPGGS